MNPAPWTAEDQAFWLFHSRLKRDGKLAMRDFAWPYTRSGLKLQDRSLRLDLFARMVGREALGRWQRRRIHGRRCETWASFGQLLQINKAYHDLLAALDAAAPPVPTNVERRQETRSEAWARSGLRFKEKPPRVYELNGGRTQRTAWRFQVVSADGLVLPGEPGDIYYAVGSEGLEEFKQSLMQRHHPDRWAATA